MISPPCYGLHHQKWFFGHKKEGAAYIQARLWGAFKVSLQVARLGFHLEAPGNVRADTLKMPDAQSNEMQTASFRLAVMIRI